jgi:type VI secretion system protein ImpK
VIDKMYWAASDALSLGSQLGLAQQLPPVDELQRRISGMFDQMARRCRDVGIPQEDFDDARYAIAAFIDEQVVRTEWPGRAQWLANPLQMVYFHENTAGEGFFTRMEKLQTQPQRAHVLEVYFWCLELGFMGKYAVGAAEGGVAPVASNVGGEVSRALPASDVISPHGEPNEAVATLVQRERPIVALSLAFFGLALLVFIGLKVALLVGTSGVNDRMTKMYGSAPPAAAGVAAPAPTKAPGKP